MEVQEAVAEQNNLVFAGKTVKVLIDQIEETTAIGRTEYDAPEVDNECLLSIGDLSVTIGSFCMATVTDTTSYELIGKVEITEPF